MELYKVAMKQSEVAMKQSEVAIEAKDEAIEAQDDLIRNLQQQLLMSRGLLTARGIYEQQLVKCLVEMKRLKLCSSNMKFNATGVIMKMVELQVIITYTVSLHGRERSMQGNYAVLIECCSATDTSVAGYHLQRMCSRDWHLQWTSKG